MTTSKLSSLLSDAYGISDNLDKWIRLGDITIITTISDLRHYISDDEIFYIDSENNLLYISQSDKFKDRTKTLEKPLDSYKINVAIDIDDIKGFSSSAAMGPYGTYYTKRIK